MSSQSLALAAGLMFLLIAIVGGGFRLERLEIPSVPRWGRLVSSVLGILLVAPYIYSGFGGRSSDDKGPTDKSSVGEVTIYADDDPDTTGDNIRLSGLRVSGPHKQPEDADRLAIRYSLTNVGDDPITLKATFIGARDPHKKNADFSEGNLDKTLAPGQGVGVSGSIVLDREGQWQFWPCYKINDRYCPDEWRAVTITVR